MGKPELRFIGTKRKRCKPITTQQGQRERGTDTAKQLVVHVYSVNIAMHTTSKRGWMECLAERATVLLWSWAGEPKQINNCSNIISRFQDHQSTRKASRLNQRLEIEVLPLLPLSTRTEAGWSRPRVRSYRSSHGSSALPLHLSQFALPSLPVHGQSQVQQGRQSPG